MIVDPRTAWNGPYPYDVLAAVGVTPHTSHADMQNVPFDLLARRMMTPHVQQAWQELRTLRRRLLVDLMLYDVDPGADVAAALEEVERALRDSGDPPEVAELLALDPALPANLADDLNEIVLEPPPEISSTSEFDDVNTPREDG